ncbi:hypothetical protein P3339_22550 [Microbulbifer sp. MLAF003]|nr:hypothetical protein [Microbulbifer sp. MLAF003]WHI51142.1 hypothetical protein P3339_22550 [Microbulbifer sp. MLAF003]
MTLLQARAIENGCFVIAANQGGSTRRKDVPGDIQRLSIPGVKSWPEPARVKQSSLPRWKLKS